MTNNKSDKNDKDVKAAINDNINTNMFVSQVIDD